MLGHPLCMDLRPGWEVDRFMVKGKGAARPARPSKPSKPSPVPCRGFKPR